MPVYLLVFWFIFVMFTIGACRRWEDTRGIGLVLSFLIYIFIYLNIYPSAHCLPAARAADAKTSNMEKKQPSFNKLTSYTELNQYHKKDLFKIISALQKRRIYMIRDLHTWKETFIHEKRPIYMKRYLCTWKETYVHD